MKRTLFNSALPLAGAATLPAGYATSTPSAKQYKMTTDYILRIRSRINDARTTKLASNREFKLKQTHL